MPTGDGLQRHEGDVQRDADRERTVLAGGGRVGMGMGMAEPEPVVMPVAAALAVAVAVGVVVPVPVLMTVSVVMSVPVLGVVGVGRRSHGVIIAPDVPTGPETRHPGRVDAFA